MEITIDMLYGDQLELANCIGIEAFNKLVSVYGGTSIYIYKADSLLKAERDRCIKKEFNGANHKALAVKYGLAENTIRQIVSGEIKKNIIQIDGQLELK